MGGGGYSCSLNPVLVFPVLYFCQCPIYKELLKRDKVLLMHYFVFILLPQGEAVTELGHAIHDLDPGFE